MSKNLSSSDVGVIVKNWSNIRKVINNILKKKLKDTSDLKHLVPMSFDKELVLGYGKWGLVVGLPALSEVVVKITTDPFEWYLMDIIMQDEYLRNHPAVPYTLGTAVLDIKSREFPLYLIVRENLRIGIPLNVSNPLVRMKNTLIQDFIGPMEDIEQDVADVLNKKNNLTLLEVSVIYSLMAGEVRKQLSKIKTRLPKLTPKSKFNNVLDLQKKLLDRGIALVDIHVNNLGTRQYKNLNKIFKDVGKLDLENVVMSDLGMAYGTPVFLESGMAYKDLEEMIVHLASILKDYTAQRYTESGIIRNNPMIYSVDSIINDLIDCCQDANLNLNNVLLDNKSGVHLDNIVNNIMKMFPKMHLNDITVAFLVKNELISVIRHWIDPFCVHTFDEHELHIKCYVDSIKNGMARCRLAHDLSFEDEAPIGLFSIPQDQDVAQTILDFFMNDKKRKSLNTTVQHIPIEYLNTLNGVKYEIITDV